VRVSGTLSPGVTVGRDYRNMGVADEGLFPSMPQDDPIETQKAVCQAITQLMQDGQSEISRLDALFALERQAQPVSELLLTQYVEGDRQLRSFDWRAWRAAMQLNQSFFQAYEYLLHRVRNTTDDGWNEHEPLVLAQLFHHRKVELLLRFLRYKKRNSGQWRQLHEMYRLARERDLLNRAEVIIETDGKRGTVEKMEQQYLQILLLEAMNNGRFSPREALWAHRWFARWCSGPTLQLTQAKGSVQGAAKGFAVDLGGSEGLQRAPATGSNLLYLDSSPLSAMIDQEIASLRDGATLPHPVTPAVRAGQLALLNKLAILFAPNPGIVERRAERKPVALTVQAIAGFSCIVEELRQSGQKQSGGASSTAAPGSEVTISPFGRSTLSPLFAAGGVAGQAIFSITDRLDVIPQTWQVKDRSDSGCRMRGQINDLNRVIPGSLIAIRDSETAPWTVSVVRWFRRLMVDHVEIGVEYLGRKPRFVKMVSGYDRHEAIDKLPDSASRCFAALYLPPSEKHPTMPIKTLLVPASEFRAGCEMTLLSSSATYRMRLNEPIQQQGEFVLTPFAVIEQVQPLSSGIQ